MNIVNESHITGCRLQTGQPSFLRPYVLSSVNPVHRTQLFQNVKKKVEQRKAITAYSLLGRLWQDFGVWSGTFCPSSQKNTFVRSDVNDFGLQRLWRRAVLEIIQSCLMELRSGFCASFSPSKSSKNSFMRLALCSGGTIMLQRKNWPSGAQQCVDILWPHFLISSCFKGS